MDARLIEGVICPACGGALATGGGGGLGCGGCGAQYPGAGGVIDLMPDSALRSTLEDADYDARAGYDAEKIARIARAWERVVAGAGLSAAGASVLELGSGTGALTAGLAHHMGAARVIATDVSAAFLRTAVARSAGGAPVLALRCDGNALPLAPGSVDLVFGRSVLHHLVDWRDVLAQCARALRPGGAAVFFEPVLEGKLVIGLFARLVADRAAADPENDLTRHEMNLLRSFARNVTKGAWYPQDRESLLKIEDKFIFARDEMRAAAIAAGFATVEVMRDDRPVQPTMWPQFMQTARLLGIDARKLRRHAWIGQAWGDTFGAFPALAVEPMAHFVLRR